MSKFSQLVLAAGLAAVTLGGCAKDAPVGMSPNVQVTELSSLPVPDSVVPYRIEPQQSLVIEVLSVDGMDGTYFVDDRGYITFPFAGEVYVAGETPSGVSRLITSRLAGRYIRDPQVRVRPTEILEPSISVGGEVNKPGTITARTSDTLVRAINNAGGLTKYAKSDDVLIMRTVGGQRYIGVYNVSAIQRGNYDDPAVYPDDIITVGDSPSRRTLETILQYVPLITTPLILLDRVLR